MSIFEIVAVFVKKAPEDLIAEAVDIVIAMIEIGKHRLYIHQIVNSKKYFKNKNPLTINTSGFLMELMMGLEPATC
ncbi:MAG TPA: hypothetical protein DIW17_04110 [Clostridiales bacterium]|nr:hypothetical protein [Clostridiales bacterium]